ncbi:Kinesin, motor region domain-containing protein [Rozella allomycis CSF55]|uniref:Kinesin-like protein n=1 Tax=Rozella allomycis (strain CSF55) TaxID=988480 RepID=A0A075AXX7_ROZAC|nr:Kinesin, motor region domain-containing protein [Rozella allomycis CSF55]|eukprot:EPZ33429.1 Kinesin, motor region domain-containing protein [Rozella allomycis CSF55]
MAAKPIIESVLAGYNGTIFAYGQTGTGKTHTMEGDKDDESMRGVIPNAIIHIFNYINENAATGSKFLVRASFLEIYNEDVYDLLANQETKLELRERSDIGVYVKNLSSFVVNSVEEMYKLMTVGNRNRSVGSTMMNARSSRSHSIFTITVEMSFKNADGQEHIKVGKLNLVDLAGSERQSKTGATGERLKEATRINLSLSALGNVISALVDGRSKHIPYRDSKLTRLLQDSLGGNSKTLMIATLSPASYNYDETLSTLRYASRAKNIKNKPKVNEDPKNNKNYKEKNENNTSENEKNDVPDFSVINTEIDNERKHREALINRKKLEYKEIELQERREKEKELEIELENQFEKQLKFEENYSSLQDEVVSKTKKLKQFWTLWNSLKVELRDSERDMQIEREDLLETIRLLSRELKLKNLIVHSFVPENVLNEIEKRSEYDNENDKWRISYIAHAGNNIRVEGGEGNRVKENSFARVKSVNRDIKSVGNKSNLNEWMGFSSNPLWQTNSVFLSYKDILPGVYENLIEKSKKENIPETIKRKSSSKKTLIETPQPRGLVSKQTRFA